MRRTKATATISIDLYLSAFCRVHAAAAATSAAKHETKPAELLLDMFNDAFFSTLNFIRCFSFWWHTHANLLFYFVAFACEH